MLESSEFQNLGPVQIIVSRVNFVLARDMWKEEACLVLYLWISLFVLNICVRADGRIFEEKSYMKEGLTA